MALQPRPTFLHSNGTNGIQHELVCIICHDIPAELPLITHCSHAFCGTCIHQALEHNLTCPVCRTPVRKRQLSPISGLVRRMWEQVRVKCPSCEWTGTIGNYEAHRARSCRTTMARAAASANEVNALKRKCNEAREELDSEKRQRICLVNNLEMELRQARSELAEQRAKVKVVKENFAKLEKSSDESINAMMNVLPILVRSLGCVVDSSYAYTRENIVSLAQLISQDLESRPSDVNANRIFNCVKNCYEDLKKYSDNPKNYGMDTQFLLATCRASAWFSAKQNSNINEWCTELGLHY